MIGSIVLDRQSAKPWGTLTRMNSDRSRVSSRGILFLAGKNCKIKIYSEVSQMRRTIFCAMVVLAILAGPLFSNSGENKSASGIYMRVTGRVIEKETGKGVKGISVTINNKIDGNDLTADSDKDGYYEIEMVPPGIYEVLIVPIHQTCPYPLVLEKKPEDFTVSIGRNITRLNIYLIKGGSLSGRVFGPDGFTPFCDGTITIVNALKGKLVEFNLLNEGKFRFDGLHCLTKNKFNFVVLVSPNGYADVAKAFQIKPGEEIKDFNFIVGVGDIQVKGNVVSAADNLPVKGAKVYIISVDRNIERAFDGTIKTDEAGNYSIQGFQNVGTAEISIFHDNFQSVTVTKEFKTGVNIFDFKLSPEQGEKKISDFFFKEMSSSTGTGGANIEGCSCIDGNSYNSDIDLSCTRLSNSKKNCLQFQETLDCMNKRCEDRQMIKIKCDKNCKPDPLNGAVPCGFAKAMNVNIKSKSEFTICFNANAGCSPLGELVTIFHELFHTCDRESEQNSDVGEPCSEARAHKATACVWDDSWSSQQSNEYSKKCRTVTPN